MNQFTVLITRPLHQSQHLCDLIEAHGAQVLRLPVIEIVEIEDKQPLIEVCSHLNKFSFLIFISANAVERTLPTLLVYNNKLPSHLQLVAVGKRTAHVLKQAGLTALCSAPPFNSEAVLALPELQIDRIQNHSIVIFRGEGGRELLADTLRKRGAYVTYVNVYRRIQPPVPAWINEINPDINIVTSVEGLHNLLNMLDDKNRLFHTPLVVISERIRTEAQILGIQAPIFVASDASDEGLLAAVLEWKNQR